MSGWIDERVDGRGDGVRGEEVAMAVGQ